MKELETRVFVVDDDQSVRTSLANLLATEDYAVEVFVSAAEYLARVPHPGPACLVLDVQLPGLDGLALQQQLTEEGRREQIVFITGYGDIPTGIRAMKCGAIDFLPKPFRDDQLLPAVAQALARSAEECQQRGEVVESRARLTKLTPREFEVFRLVRIRASSPGGRLRRHADSEQREPSDRRRLQNGRPQDCRAATKASGTSAWQSGISSEKRENLLRVSGRR